jgi:hypothetical protein
LAIAAILVLSPACTIRAANSPVAKVLAPSWREVERSVQARREVSARFEASHGFTGKTAEEAMRQLSQEHFNCALRYATAPRLVDNARMRYEVVEWPFVLCWRPGHRDTCPFEHVTLEVGWLNEQATAEELAHQYGQSTVKVSSHLCLDQAPDKTSDD